MVELPESIEPETVQKLMELAQMHDLTAIVGSALVEQGLISQPEVQKALQKAVCRAAVLCENNIHQLQWLCQIFEEAQIPFIPLKGSVVREFYPEPWLRSSCDIDILVREKDLDEAVSLLISKGCLIHNEKKQHDISLVTPGRVHLELHYRLLESVESIDGVLDRVWEHSKLMPGKQYAYRQDGAFLLFHLIAHMAYHCSAGGSGIRSFVDIWRLEEKLEYDRDELRKLCRQAQLEKFYDNVQHLVSVWFDGKEHTAVTKWLEQVVVSGGTFGNNDARIMMNQAKIGSKQKRLAKRIFMPYEGLKTQYPILEKKRWLMPFFQVVRWLRIFTGGRLRRAIGEYKISSAHSDMQIKETKLFLEQVGLDFI